MRVVPENLAYQLEAFSTLLFIFWPPIAIGAAGYVVLRVGGNMGRHPVAMAIGYGLVTFAGVMGLIIFLGTLISQI